MKKNFKTYVQEQHQDYQQKLLDLVSQDPEQSRKLAIRFLEKNAPVPELLIKSVSSSAGQSMRLADAYAQRKMPPPKDLLWTVADDPEYSFMLSTTYLKNNMQIPDVIMVSITHEAKSSIRFATSWHTYRKDDVPSQIIKTIANSPYYSQQYKNFLESSNLPLPSLIEKSAKKDAKEENEEQGAFQNVQKYKDKLLQVISQDPHESIKLMLQLAKKGKVAPPILFKSVVAQNKQQVDQHFGGQLIRLTDVFYEKDMQLPEFFYKHMLQQYPIVIVRNTINKNLPIPEKALQQVLKNPFQTASIVSFLLKRKKEIPEEMMTVLQKNPKTITYVMGDVVNFINKHFLFKDVPFDAFMSTRFPEKLLKIIKQNASVQQDVVKILKTHDVSEEVIQKYFKINK